MIRPYFAVIVDSFREAMVSRVLWIVIVLFTMVLLSLAPLAIEMRAISDFGQRDVLNWDEFTAALRAGKDSPDTAAGVIWAALDDQTKSNLENSGDPDMDRRQRREIRSRLVDDVRDVLKDSKLSSLEVWKDTDLSDEAEALLAQQEHSEIEKQRLNRLLLDRAFAGMVRASTASSVQWIYGPWDLFDPQPVRIDQVTDQVRRYAITLIDILVGAVGIFIAILVTASIVPKTFETGSIDLLLSKPVSRPLLFLTKYLGGCIFTFFNAGYLITGLWLILGIRFDIWDAKLLLSVPIFVFLFAVYYSVSAFAGVVWRNSIVAVVLSTLIWLLCTAVGTSKEWIEFFALNPGRITGLTETPEGLIGVTEVGEFLHWKKGQGDWTEVMKGVRRGFPGPPLPRRTLGPIFDAEQNAVLALDTTIAGGLASRKLIVGDPSDAFTAKRGAAVPLGTFELMQDGSGQTIAIARTGIFRLAGKAGEEAENVRLLNIDLPFAQKGPFVPIGPNPRTFLITPASAAIDQNNNALAVWSNQNLYLFEPDSEGVYQKKAERELTADARGVLLGFSGGTIFAVHIDGLVQQIDPEDLSVRNESEPESGMEPRFVYSDPNDKSLAIVFQNRMMHVFDHASQTWTAPRIGGQADVSSALYTGRDTILVASGKRVEELSLADWSIIQQVKPPAETVEVVYRFMVMPIYTVLPKQRELSNTVAYLLRDQETMSFNDTANIGDPAVHLNPWKPVRSSTLFIGFVLLLTCVYIYRKDF